MRPRPQFAADLVGERRAFPDLAADTPASLGNPSRLAGGLSPGPGSFAKTPRAAQGFDSWLLIIQGAERSP